jgi:hypothetical protein
MPDKNKVKVFQETGMKIFKSCILCRHGEIPGNAWGYCKNQSHFFTHAKHGRMPGVAHASMGCDDFAMMGQHTREMTELGVYTSLIPYHDEEVEVVGVEEEAEEPAPAEPPIMEFQGDALAKTEPEPQSGQVTAAVFGAQEIIEEPEPPEPEPEPEAPKPTQSARERLRRGET